MSNYLGTTDHYSDFIEVDELENAPATIAAKTEAHFACHGVPVTILTDNGPQFIASDFERLCQRYQTNHVTSSPYWPKGNGKSEASVKIVKHILKSGKNGLHEALLVYRNTPQEGHILSLAQKSMGRRTRSLLPISTELLLPSDNTAEVVREAIATKQARAKQHYDTAASSTLPSLEIADFVYAKPAPHHKSGPWLYGLVTAIPAPRSHIVETLAGLTRRNRAHLRLAAPLPPGVLVPRSWVDKLSPSPVLAAEHSARLPPTPRVAQPVNPTCIPPSTPPVVQPSAFNEPPMQNTMVEPPTDQAMPVPLATNIEDSRVCSRSSSTAKRSQANMSVTKTRLG